MKVNVKQYKESVNESNFTDSQIAILWDFYVTKSIAGSASQQRKVSDYGIKKLPYEEMMKCADISDNNNVALLSDKMPDTMKEMDLQIV